MRSEQRLSLVRVQAELASWREHHGGRGKPIPDRFWVQAITLARNEGVSATAKALRLDEARLARRMQTATGPVEEPEARFIELDVACVLPPSGQVVLEVLGRDGERLRLHLAGASTEQLVALVRAFAREAP